MNRIFIIGLLITIIVYMFFLYRYILNRSKTDSVEVLMGYNRKNVKLINYERKILDLYGINYSDVIWLIYISRMLIFLVTIVLLYNFRGLVLLLVGAIIVIVVSNQAYTNLIYDSGIENISRVMNFINYFVPHITSGNSADQSFLGYIEYSGEKLLADYYEDNMTKLPRHLKQIADIYDIAKYNEEKGISDYTYILNEISKDISQKQTYYNSFIAKIGEIQPVVWSYYIGVPILIIISFGQTADFWMGMGGYIVSIILLIMFTIFKFLIYKIQKNSITTIF